ncbi:MAG: hypothetical protein ABIQ18_03345 [Umezawaea sp.]
MARAVGLESMAACLSRRYQSRAARRTSEMLIISAWAFCAASAAMLMASLGTPSAARTSSTNALRWNVCSANAAPSLGALEPTMRTSRSSEWLRNSCSKKLLGVGAGLAEHQEVVQAGGGGGVRAQFDAGRPPVR